MYREIFEYMCNLTNKKVSTNENKSLRMYVLVRQDLAETYRMVQGAHALQQYNNDARYNTNCRQALLNIWNNQYLIFLGVPNLITLKDWDKRLNAANICFSKFNEPDLDGQLTAIACINTGEIFDDLPLAR